MNRNSKLKITKFTIGIAILSCVVFYFDVNIIKTFEYLSRPGFLYLSLLVPVFINPAISSNRWKVLLSVQGVHESVFSLAKISFTSIFLGIFLPSTTGSDVIRIYQIESKHNTFKGAGAAPVIVERLFGLLLLSFIGVIGSSIAVSYGLSIKILFVSGVMNFVFLFFLLVLKIFSLNLFMTSVLSKLKKGLSVTGYINAVLVSVNKIPLRKVMLPTLLLISAFQVSTIVCAYLLFRAFNIDIPFYYHFSFMPVIQIMSVIPLSVSGFGIRESGFVYLYGLIGIDPGVSFMVSILYYSVLIFVPAFIGMILYFTDCKFIDTVEITRKNND
ncbi:MAG TPA: lysylphosphatidylglycerol synthase transmembrane domain-containing protein [Clostridiales bacterium]|nr:lysylphosphatidylglycerol synthase transmembrane domain-containing protein [Clostridiales bacterium]